MYQAMNFQQWTEYKALIRAFVAKNEPLLDEGRAKYLRDLESFRDEALVHVLTKFQTNS